MAIGAAEKGVAQVYETAFRPPERRYRPWVERCHTQMHAALAELDRLCQVRAGEWLIGNRITQADITATCVYTFLSDALAINRNRIAYPATGRDRGTLRSAAGIQVGQGRLVCAGWHLARAAPRA